MTIWVTTPPLNATESQQNWLSNTDSLTNRVRAVAKQNFKLTVIQQGWRAATPAETQLLNTPRNEKLFARTITMGANNTPWLIGYSLFPQSLLKQHLDSLTNLEQTPLGDLLFNQLSAQRERLNYCELTQIDELYQLAKPFLSTPTSLLARRSNFLLGEQQLAVHEIFLPALWQALEA